MDPPQHVDLRATDAAGTSRKVCKEPIKTEVSVFLDNETGEMPQSSPNNDLGAPVIFLDCRLTQRCSLIVD